GLQRRLRRHSYGSNLPITPAYEHYLAISPFVAKSMESFMPFGEILLLNIESLRLKTIKIGFFDSYIQYNKLSCISSMLWIKQGQLRKLKAHRQVCLKRLPFQLRISW